MGGIIYSFIKFREVINVENILVEYSVGRRPFERQPWVGECCG
jgi:hypothetical protein